MCPSVWGPVQKGEDPYAAQGGGGGCCSIQVSTKQQLGCDIGGVLTSGCLTRSKLDFGRPYQARLCSWSEFRRRRIILLSPHLHFSFRPPQLSYSTSTLGPQSAIYPTRSPLPSPPSPRRPRPPLVAPSQAQPHAPLPVGYPDQLAGPAQLGLHRSPPPHHSFSRILFCALSSQLPLLVSTRVV